MFKKSFAALGLVALAFTTAAQADDKAPSLQGEWHRACVSYLPGPDADDKAILLLSPKAYTPDALRETMKTDPYDLIFAMRRNAPAAVDARNAAARRMSVNIAQATVDHAFDNDARGNAFLMQAKRTLNGLLQRLPHANTAERQYIAKTAYDLRLTLERRNFAYHYAMAAQTVSMAAGTGTTAKRYTHDEGITADRDWVALYQTVNALQATMIHDLGRTSKRMIYMPSAELRAEAEKQYAICGKNNWSGSLAYDINRQVAMRRARDVIFDAALKP